MAYPIAHIIGNPSKVLDVGLDHDNPINQFIIDADKFLEQGNWPQALYCAEQAAKLADHELDDPNQARALVRHAEIHRAQGHDEEVLQCYRKAASLFERSNKTPQLAITQTYESEIHRAHQRWDQVIYNCLLARNTFASLKEDSNRAGKTLEAAKYAEWEEKIRRVLEEASRQPRPPEPSPQDATTPPNIKSGAPENSSAGSVHFRLDIAVPDLVYQGRKFQLSVALRPASSPMLAEGAPQANVASGDMYVDMSKSEPGIIQILVSALECEIHDLSSYNQRIFPNRPPPVSQFFLTPQQLGKIDILVKAYQGQFFLGNAQAHTICERPETGGQQPSQPPAPKPAPTLRNSPGPAPVHGSARARRRGEIEFTQLPIVREPIPAGTARNVVGLEHDHVAVKELIIHDQRYEIELLRGRRHVLLTPGHTYVTMLVKGDSMDKIIADGSYVIVHLLENGEVAEGGDIVVSEISDDGEVTLKKCAVHDGIRYLEAQSTNPEFQDYQDVIDEIDVRIRGIVIALLRPVREE